ncbi:MAG: helicase HerA domain-containing protein, partial [Gemmatimonadota bacterium]
MEYEKLGVFYLGRETRDGEDTQHPVLYDARDLTTHAVCIGMTGSGKTGLCVDLLEEAALDRVPALLIDPKGDLTNLLLAFPELAAADFRPWVNPDDARRAGQDPDEFAAAQARLWRDGLAEWGQSGERIRALRESADVAIFTPGSEAGIPVSVLRSFDAPDADWDADAEFLRERVAGIVSGLLGLAGIEADPLQSREHILLATVIEHAWRAGRDLDIASLIRSVQDPPMRRLGVFDVDTFFPQKERLALAMRLNNLVAAPGFRSWVEGQPLDVPGFLTAPDGRPRHSIFYIAHLSEAERMFFVTLLLSQVVAWMRAQTGTTSLRAMLYMDEVFGFLPPVAEPPSKRPLLTLLKQARAYGLGVVLTTQNPVDLDYKALTNAGTWFLGRLQTERDKARVLEGLDTLAGAGVPTRAELDTRISGLGKREFLLHNVHEESPVTFRTRWAMSYLRGPLTREQVAVLMEGRGPDPGVESRDEGRAASPAQGAVSPVEGAPSPGEGTASPAMGAGSPGERAPSPAGSAAPPPGGTEAA